MKNLVLATLAAAVIVTPAHATCYTVSWDQLTMSILSPIPAEETKLVPCYVCGGGEPPITSPLVPPPVVDIIPPPYVPPVVINPPPCLTCGPPIVVPQVPEASTWAMMLIGFACIGFSMFRQRVTNVSRG